MVQLAPDDKAYLEALAGGPVSVFTYRGGRSDELGGAAARKMDELSAQGLVRFVERRGDRNSPAGDVWNVYALTSVGRCILDVAKGRPRVSAKELAEAGCG
jgi:hypothetical protein